MGRSQASDIMVQKIILPDKSDKEYYLSVFDSDPLVPKKNIQVVVNLLLNNLFVFAESSVDKAVERIYLKHFVNKDSVVDLDLVVQPNWVNADDTFEMVACSVITQLCLSDYENLTFFLDIIANEGFYSHYSNYKEMKSSISKDIMIEIIGTLRNIKHLVLNDSILDSFVHMIFSNKSVSDFANKYDVQVVQSIKDYVKFYYSIFKSKNRRAILSYIFLRDFLESDKAFSIYANVGCMDLICNSFTQNAIRDFPQELVSRAVHFVRKWERLNLPASNRHDPKLLASITERRVTKIASSMENAVMEYSGANSIKSLLSRILADLPTQIVRHTWSMPYSRLFEIPDQYNIDVAEKIIHDFFFNEIYLDLANLKDKIGDRGLSLLEQKDLLNEIASRHTPAKDYIHLTDTLNDYSAMQRTEVCLLEWFYDEVQLKTSINQDESTELRECQNKVGELEEKLELANAKISKFTRLQNSARPQMMNLSYEARSLNDAIAEKEKIEQRYEEAMSEIAAQNEYIALLQNQIASLATRVAELEPETEVHKSVYVERVAVLGNLTGNDQQRVKKHLPNAIFISDLGRDIPKDIPVIVVICRMKHKLMFKTKSLADKKNLYYYNGVSMQNVYKALEI